MKTSSSNRQRSRPPVQGSREDGFGIIEVIVAMTLIAILLIALAPFLISSFQTAGRHIRIAGATTEVDSRVAEVIGSSNCTELVDYTTPRSILVPATSRNVELRVLQTAMDAQQNPITLSACRDHAQSSGIANYYYVIEVHDESRYEEDRPLAVGRSWVAVRE